MLIFDHSKPGRKAGAQLPDPVSVEAIPAALRRTSAVGLPEASELDVVRHYTRLSQQNFSIDTNFYPLGSCTMKYNPRGVHRMALLSGFAKHHPYSSLTNSQGVLGCLYELQCFLSEITGMAEVALSPMAGAQGEYAGIAMIKAYHDERGDVARTEILVPDAAHGTNPASAVQCGYTVREIPTQANGDIDIVALEAALGPQTAGIMLTNPSTLGVFERDIKRVAELVHTAGGLLYYDGANLNAILGKVRPGDMGFDVMHMNLHKTFATPHGGGGPGAGPVAVAERLAPYLPIPRVAHENGQYRWMTRTDCPKTIGRLSGFMGNVGILLRAYFYICLLGKRGLERVAEFATLNANYVMQRLANLGYELAYPERKATHEFLITLKSLTKQHGVTARDVAKRLLDYGIHAPTVYFPLLVAECMLIEPTETESKETVDRFIEVMAQIKTEAEQQPDLVKQAPHTCPVSRLDEVKAAKVLDIVYQGA